MLKRILKLPRRSKFEYGLILLILLFIFCVKPFQITKVFSLGTFSFIDIPLINGSLIYILISLGSIYYFRKINYGKVELAWLLILSFSMLSITWSVNPALNLAANAIMGTAFLTYIIFKGFLSNTKSYFGHQFISLIMATFTFLFCVSYLYFNREKMFMLMDGQAGLEIMQNAPSFVGGKNHTSMFLFLCFPFILFSFYSQRWRNFSIVMLMVVASTIFITESRNAYLSLIVSLGAIFMLYKVPKISKYIPALLILGAVGFLVLVYNVDSAVDLRTIDYRFGIWDLSLEMFKDADSLLGIGAGQWNLLKDNIIFLGGNFNYVHAHSDLLTYFTELGPIGLLLFVGFISFLSKKALDNCNNITGVGQGWIDKVLVGFFIGSIVLFSFDELKMKLNHLQLLAILWAYIMYRNEKNFGFEFKLIPQVVFKAITAVIFIALFVYAFLLIEQSVVVSNYNKVTTEKQSETLKYLNQFKPGVVNKFEDNTFWYERSELKKLAEDEKGSIEDLHKSLEYFPNDIQTHKELVRRYFGQEHYAKVLYHCEQLNKYFHERKFVLDYLKKLEKLGYEVEKVRELKKPIKIIYN